METGFYWDPASIGVNTVLKKTTLFHDVYNLNFGTSPDAPIVVITGEVDGSEVTSEDEVLQVTAEEGDSAPTFSCSSEGAPQPTLSWRGQDGGVALPSGVTMAPTSQNLALVWSRALQYTDSGNYVCNASNSVGSSAVRLELLVRCEC